MIIIGKTILELQEQLKEMQQSINDMQAQLIARDKQVAFLQGQVFTFQWIIKHGDNDTGGWTEFDLDLGDDT